MAVYVIYHRENGEIVHTHIQPEDVPIDREGLLALLDRRQDIKKLATILVDPSHIREGCLYRVKPKTRELQQVDAKAASGFGAGAVTYVSSASPSSPTKVTYSREGPRESEKR